MLDLNETLVVTAPVWGTSSSTLAVDIRRVSESYHVDIVDAPLFQMEMANDAVLRRSCVSWPTGMASKTKPR